MDEMTTFKMHEVPPDKGHPHCGALAAVGIFRGWRSWLLANVSHLAVGVAQRRAA